MVLPFFRKVQDCDDEIYCFGSPDHCAGLPSGERYVNNHFFPGNLLKKYIFVQF